MEKRMRAKFRESTNSSRKFYEEHHRQQTYDIVKEKQERFKKFNLKKASVWDAFRDLDTIHDNSDPDTKLAQSSHAFQTAEAMRKDGQPDWMIMTGLIHDLGKILLLAGEPQWAVVGDTFPVGCRYSPKIVHYGYLHYNEDFSREQYQKRLGIYQRGCGWDNLDFTWGHDEYLYSVLKNAQERDPNSMKLPEEALYIIRYHSFYPGHQEGAYSYFMDDKDRSMAKYLKIFQRYDLYTKDDKEIPVDESYYRSLVDRFIPGILDW